VTVRATERVAHEAPDVRSVTTFTISLRDVSDLSAMRSALRQHLRAVEVAPPRIADAELVATELATNAAKAAREGTAVEVVGRVDEGRLMIAVTNRHRLGTERAPLSAPVTMPGADAERGRGLATVAALAWRVSADVEPDHTTVQAELTI
jgi:anti-sigma regulatory factor (Ser/Thr protein kinase)